MVSCLMKKRTAGKAVFLFVLSVMFFPAFLNTGFSASFSPAAAYAGTDAVSPVAHEETYTHPPAPKLKAQDYPIVMGINSRVFVWMAAQLHLWFAAFVLAVPIFVFIIEAVGMATKDERYDKMAYEFIKVSLTAYSVTALIGGLLAFSLFVFYPDLMRYMTRLFGQTMLLYALLFFAESATLYIYYYGWHAMERGFSKWAHLTIGLLLNAVGTTLMFLANAWVTFMMSPSGVDAGGVFDGNIWHVIHNHLWNPINLHRFVANIAFGGSIVGAYAAYRFLSARSDSDRAHYDWMGYTANLIAISALLPLPFAGYWLTAEIYAYSQQMGITLMGGAFAWLFITQAVIIGALFLSANYYLWCGMERSPGAYRYTKYIKYIAAVIVVCFLVWFTPHTLILKPWELKALGGQYHPFLGPLGIMPAKNTAVNIMLIFTFLSFLLYRRANKIAVVSWAPLGRAAQAAVFAGAILNIVFLGVYYGYFTNTVYKVASSVPQVASTLTVIAACMVIDFFMFKGAKDVGELRWGGIPQRSQYALFLLAVSFTWLMGLMGFIRSSIRQHWHVYSVMRDASVNAYTLTIASAAKTVSAAAIIFMAMVIFIFWLSALSSKKQDKPLPLGSDAKNPKEGGGIR
ncbi:MAG: cytochrome ubiquinol oxidase subunit I [Deltaproteobacteria bacterium]|nr:cytochrome ubiquinol oxidase subunit I [Deltaproteobacteria bacterium]